MSYNKVLLDKVYELYGSEKIGYSSICEQCKKESLSLGINLNHGPVPIFHIGKDFDKIEKRLLIVGLVAYGWNDIIPDFNKNWKEVSDGNQNTINEMQESIENRVKELFYAGDVKYYNFLNFALSGIYGNTDAAFNSVAITNFVRCNDGAVQDGLPQFVREYCSDSSKNGFIHKEIELLKPTHILILSTSHKYLRFIRNSNYKTMSIIHPSAPGRSKIGLRDDILKFLDE